MTETTAQPKQIGIYNLHMAARGGGEKLTLVLAEHLSHSHRVQIFHNVPLEINSLEATFAVDLSRVQFTKVDPLTLSLRVLPKIRGGGTSPISLHHCRRLKKLDLDLFINVSFGSLLPCPAKKGIFVCMFPHDDRQNRDGASVLQSMRNTLANSIERVLTGTDVRRWLESYSEIIAISQYSANWVHRLWRRQAEVIYPPVDDMGPPVAKEKIILHVGRFTAAKTVTHHDKAQEVLLAAFDEMTELHRAGWELHFVGNIGLDSDAQQLSRMLLEQAVGLPVRFHFNATFEQLRNLYRRAAIYWHATGVGVDARQYPDRQEHFGITTAEAMTAGAVPVVINSGGQKEIVTDGINGFRWNDLDDLMKKTRRLVDDADLRERLSRAAVETSKKFRREVFGAGMNEFIARALKDNQ